jgi:general secretion pathway protein H
MRASRGRRAAARGFTLIELLVTIVVAGVILSMLSLGGTGAAERALRFEAERVAQLLSLAREEAQVLGAPIRFEVDSARYRFVIRQDREWRPITDPDLRERAWERPTRVRIERADGRPLVEFGRDAVDIPFVLRLSRDADTVTIAANGLGAFELQ